MRAALFLMGGTSFHGAGQAELLPVWAEWQARSFLRQWTGSGRQINKALLKRITAAGGTLSGREHPQEWKLRKTERFCNPVTQWLRQQPEIRTQRDWTRGKIE